MKNSSPGLIVDLFAGGGGASVGIEHALERPVDIAVNHDPVAIAVHQANHPYTAHYVADVFDVDPMEATQGQPVDLLWASPDCKHFSTAKGGKPKSESVRSLAWVVTNWAAAVRPRVICLENVREFQTWGPLKDGRPIREQMGTTFNEWVGLLEHHGYKVETKMINAADFGAPTSRTRLFVIARRDGEPIRWPEPSHGEGRTPYRTAAEIVDWSIETPSIFTPGRRLAEKTLKRVALGVKRYVIDAARPFLVNLTHGVRNEDLNEPTKTITAAPRGEKALCVPTLVQTGYGERKGQAPRVPGLGKPLGTVMAGGAKHALVGAMLKHYGGVVGQDLDKPLGTITATDSSGPIAAHITKFYGTSASGQSAEEPLGTVTSGGFKFGTVAAWMMKYYGTANGQEAGEPLHTITTKARFALVAAFLREHGVEGIADDAEAVTVVIDGTTYAIVDIGLRMLQPEELLRAQFGHHGDVYDLSEARTKTAKTRLIGNSVCPDVASAIVRANTPYLAATHDYEPRQGLLF